MIGQKFNRLTVVEFSHKAPNGHHWSCLCECGKITKVTKSKLTKGLVKSCGCLRGEVRVQANRSRSTGAKSHKLYSTWRGMIGRCLTPTNKDYHNYGGRGITVSDRWLQSFWNFVVDMGERPEGCTLDRIDNDGPYSEENCRWETARVQSANQRIPKMAKQIRELQEKLATCTCSRVEPTGGKHHE